MTLKMMESPQTDEPKWWEKESSVVTRGRRRVQVVAVETKPLKCRTCSAALLAGAA